MLIVPCVCFSYQHWFLLGAENSEAHHCVKFGLKLAEKAQFLPSIGHSMGGNRVLVLDADNCWLIGNAVKPNNFLSVELGKEIDFLDFLR